MAQTTSSDAQRSAAALLSGYSLEMTAKDTDELRASARAIPEGTRVHLTSLTGESEDQRIAAASLIRDLGFVAVPHVAARRLGTEQELGSFLRRLASIGVDQLFVVGGDPATPLGPYEDARAVVATGLLEQNGFTGAGFAGYPEGHPDIADERLRDSLREKLVTAEQHGLTPTVVTQFGFDVDPVVAWIRDLREDGITAPLRIGIPGPTSVRRLIGFARRFGIGANAMIVKKYGFSLTNLVGTAGPNNFVRDLGQQLERAELSHGVGLHFYTFGGLGSTADWVQREVDGR